MIGRSILVFILGFKIIGSVLGGTGTQFQLAHSVFGRLLELHVMEWRHMQGTYKDLINYALLHCWFIIC